MPELRSGARRACLRSKKVDKAADPVGSPAVPPPQGRARRRGGAVADWLVVVEVTRQLLRVEGGQLLNTQERGSRLLICRLIYLATASLNLLFLARQLLAQPTRTFV